VVTAATIAGLVCRALGADGAEHRANHTGVGKLSFEVTRGADRLWARVAATAEEDDALRRWAEHADRLSDRYAAPPVLETLRVDGRTTLVFPFLPAVERDVAAEEVLDVLHRLHADCELATALGPPVTARASFTRIWLRRLRADLEIVRGHVADDVHDWMRRETDAVSRLVDGRAFDEVIHAPIHGDPWQENIHPGADRWWLLDWEDLDIGDPVVDDAIAAPGLHDTPRHRVAHRVVMLDAAVDGAADWVENHDPVIRAAKEESYRRAIEEYETTWR
jgi:hypothetical protein